MIPKVSSDWTISKVRDKFSWSPMDRCEGLTIENPVAITHCGSGAGWSSDQEMVDVLSLGHSNEEFDDDSDSTE
ncbi:hypothetical protein VP1G_11003 [Cytospora mali]|uniref:Uncharacterized protein n=1 Tax=Cytospora mali TaxID=578113 RepID=A0A194V2J2_CYTMA|nr:hypothetical protein VP1G_11003 [Valsa mali var. pyri (nom. inval.)]